MHAYHDGLPGYSPNQILHDGCSECEIRSEQTAGGLTYLDRTNVAKAWARAAEWNQNGLPDIARAEVKLLNTLWVVQCQLENFGCPVGVIPVGLSA